MTDATLQLIIKLKDEASRALQGIRGALGDVAGQARAAASSVGDTLGGALASAGRLAGTAAVGGMLALGGALGGGAFAGLSFNNSMEQVSAQLMAFTKDAGATADILAMVQQRAKETPFAFNEMAQAAAALIPSAKQSGVALEELIAQAEILAASNPAEGLEGAAFSLKEALSGDFTSIIERFNLPRQRLNELKEQGVPALEAVQIAMRELGLDADLVGNLAGTLEGRWGALTDTLTTLAARMTQPIFDAASNGLARLTGILDENAPRLEAFADLVAGRLQQGINWLGANGLPLLLAGWGRLQGLVAAAQPILQAAHERFDSIALGVRNLALVAQGNGIGELFTVFEDGSSAFGSFLERLGLSESAAQSVNGVFMALQDALGGVGGAVSQVLPIVQPLVDALGNLWGTFRDAGPLSGAFLEALSGIPAAFGEVRIRLVEAAGQVLPGLIDAVRPWSLALLSWIADAAPGMLAAFWAQTRRLLEAAGAALPGIVEALARWGAALVDWVIAAAPELLGQLGLIVADILAWAAEQVPGIAAQLAEWIPAFLGWVGDTAPRLIIALGELLGQLLTWIYDNRAPIMETLGEWATAFSEWAITQGLPALGQALLDIAGGVGGFIADKWQAAFAEGSLGAEIVEGIKTSITGAWDGFMTWLTDMVRGAASGAVSFATGGLVPGIPGFATGVQNFRGGLAYVHAGELLVNLPRGTDVIPASTVAGIGGGGGLVIGSLTVQVTEPVRDARQLAQELLPALQEVAARERGRNLDSGL